MLQLGDVYRPRFIVLRGDAGVGKTAVLRTLAGRGYHVLDLEQLAGHRGSAFGGAGLEGQPTGRQFASRISAVVSGASDAVIYAEVEGPALGRLAVPLPLARVLGRADYVLIRDTLERRIARITAIYCNQPRADLVEAVARVEARVGAAVANRAQVALLHDDVASAVATLLPYYDRAYAHNLAVCPGRLLTTIDVGDSSPEAIASQLELAAGIE